MMEQTANAVPAGGPEAGAGGVTGTNSTTGQPDQSAGQPKGKPGPSTTGEGGSSNGKLARAFESGPEAGAGGVTGTNSTTGQPDQNAGQPKGKLGPTQTNDNLPHWTQQLSKRHTADPNLVASLQAYKSLDEFVQAYLDAPKTGNIPGEKATPEELQAFYERLGKPKEAGAYNVAKSDPDFAKIAFETNLTNAQADTLYKASLAQLDGARNLAKAQLAQDFQATDTLLQKEFGDKYEEAITLMQRGLGNNPTTGQLSGIAQSLIDAGLAGKPEIVRAFIELGRAVSESTAAGGSFRTSQPGSVMEGRGFEYKENYLKE